jgi:saccharopine dehydrogenase-like NADP-dependent oxidoreductase
MANEKSFAVIGLGQYGLSVAKALLENKQQVIGIDRDETRVKMLEDKLASVFTTDCTNITSLREVGVQNVDVAILTCKPACLSRCCCSLILTLIIFIFSSIMDSFESSPTITFIQVDYDPALIPSSWTVFSAGVFLKTLSSHCVFDSLYRSIQREARRCSPTK